MKKRSNRSERLLQLPEWADCYCSGILCGADGYIVRSQFYRAATEESVTLKRRDGGMEIKAIWRV